MGKSRSQIQMSSKKAILTSEITFRVGKHTSGPFFSLLDFLITFLIYQIRAHCLPATEMHVQFVFITLATVSSLHVIFFRIMILVQFIFNCLIKQTNSVLIYLFIYFFFLYIYI